MTCWIKMGHYQKSKQIPYPHRLNWFYSNNTSSESRNGVICKATCLHEQLGGICSSISCHLGDYGFRYPWLYITDRSALNGAINDKPGNSHIKPSVPYPMSPLFRTNGTLNNGHNYFVVLWWMALPFNIVMRYATFRQDNAQPHVAGIVQIFLDT